LGAPGLAVVAMAALPTTDGGYVVAGYVTDESNKNWEVLLVKTDNNGNVGSIYLNSGAPMTGSFFETPP
jgi:hypothetical protein